MSNISQRLLCKTLGILNEPVKITKELTFGNMITLSILLGQCELLLLLGGGSLDEIDVVLVGVSLYSSQSSLR